MDDQILALLQRKKEGLSFRMLAMELHLSGREKQILKKRLKRLEGLGLIVSLKRRYLFPARAKLVRGKFISSLRGYGFVSPEGGLTEDIFIPGRYAGGALNGDVVEVLCQEKGKKGKPEGRVVRVVRRAKERIVGFYCERFGQPFFLPLDSPTKEEIPLTLEKNLFPRPGMIVAVDRSKRRLIEVLGMPDEPGVDTKVVIERYGLASSFSEEALGEAESFPSEISPGDKKARKDYRRWLTVTIDGESAQDFDDAVSIKKLASGHFLLGVHIADVSHYVRPGSLLDAEAFKRGTSVYFPDLTLPMLPERLSNGLCSLRPREERLAFSVLLEIDEKGETRRTEFHPSLIKTAERMTYDSVYRIFEEDTEERRRFSRLVPDLLLMRGLSRVLRKKRERKGSLDFDLLEPELVYREGSLQSILPFERNEAHQLIEEFMVAANEAVASFLHQHHVPFLYRVHPPPDLKDLESLREMLAYFGLSLPLPKRMSSKDLQQALNKVKGKPEEKFVSLQVLKSMRLAVYSDENQGHYGLAKEFYTHFTSPIRRYPDLAVHRALKRALKQKRVDASALPGAALHCSQQERKADEAEKELMEWRIYRFLKGKLGEEFEGIIVDINRAGLVVELDNYFVDGIVPYADLGGDYYFKKSDKTLVGRRSGRRFELGERLRVVLVSVDPILRRMGLTLKQERKGEF
jgi:ribonuclease R